MRHLLDAIPYKDLTPAEFELPPRSSGANYIRSPMVDQTFVPDHYANLMRVS
jgi:hypothetical protein